MSEHATQSANGDKPVLSKECGKWHAHVLCDGKYTRCDCECHRPITDYHGPNDDGR